MNIIIDEVKDKKKRGRKPKNVEDNMVEQPIVEKKKRGRKPKPKNENDNEVKIPKKRGRKPLDSNKNSEPNKNIKITEENVILHLPIKSTELDNNSSESYIMKYNPEITIPIPFSEELNYQELEYNELNMFDKDKTKNSEMKNSLNNEETQLDDKETLLDDNETQLDDKETLIDYKETLLYDKDDLLDDKANNNNNISEILLSGKNNKDVVDKFESITNKYNNISIYEKNKVLPILLEYNETNKNKQWPSCVSVNCFWCCESFDSVPVGIPIKKIKNTYSMFGNFCSPECSAAYIFDNKRFLNDCWDRYSMLNIIYGNNEAIKIAPSNLCLKKFGGRLTINEFRNICTKFNKSYKLLLPPMISVLPMIEEINLNDDNTNIDMYLLNKDHINKANEEYRLKRNKPLPDSKNTLETCMNLKVL